MVQSSGFQRGRAGIHRLIHSPELTKKAHKPKKPENVYPAYQVLLCIPCLHLHARFSLLYLHCSKTAATEHLIMFCLHSLKCEILRYCEVWGFEPRALVQHRAPMKKIHGASQDSLHVVCTVWCEVGRRLHPALWPSTKGSLRKEVLGRVSVFAPLQRS